MVLAHASLQDKFGRPPILLFDDIAAHLDPARRVGCFHSALTYQGRYGIQELTRMPFQRFNGAIYQYFEWSAVSIILVVRGEAKMTDDDCTDKIMMQTLSKCCAVLMLFVNGLACI